MNNGILENQVGTEYEKEKKMMQNKTDYLRGFMCVRNLEIA